MKPSPSSRRGVLVLAAGLLLTPAVAACGSSSSSSSSSSASGSVSDVTVAGGFGQKPTLTVPGGKAPDKLGTKVLSQGTGPAVASGQTIVVNYLGQTWEPKDGKPNVFDNSFDKKQPANFPIGKGQVIPGWDKTLVGQKAGSRVLLSVPPAEGYGKDPSNALAKNTLLFVVDVLGSFDAKATATGTAAPALPKGFPVVASKPGAIPAVTSVKGVTPAKASQSALLLQGGGAPIDPSKFLAIQLVQADATTGKALNSTWTSAGPQLLAAKDALSAVTALKGAKVGSRAVVISPRSTTKNQPSVIVVLDVLGQF